MPLDNERYTAQNAPMIDIQDFVLGHLKADSRSLNEMERNIGVPAETLRDIRSGFVKSPRIDTLRKIATHYMAAQPERAQ